MKKATLNPGFYQEMTKKNIGVYTQEEQNRLRDGKVIVLGLGGLAWLYYFDRALPDVVSPKCDRPQQSPEDQ